MKTHNLKGSLAIAIGFLMVFSALLVIFDSPQGTSQADSMVQNPGMKTAATGGGYVPVNTGTPLTADSILKTIASQGIPSKYVYIPNVNSDTSSSSVTPLYSRSPAPMGVADYGLIKGPGSTSPYSYDTTSFQGTAMFEAFEPYYPLNKDPETASVQLNTVLNGVTIFGVSGYVYWAQVVAYYSPSAGSVEIVDNIWNFSSPSMYFPSNSIYSGSGQVVSNMFYYGIGPHLDLSLGFTLELYSTSMIVDNRNAIAFSYAITNTESESTVAQGVFDTVVFNSVLSGSSTTTGMAYFHVDGNKRTPAGMLYDAEMVVGGPGAGSNTAIYEANGQLNLKFLSGTTYTKLTSTYNFGSNAGETAEGLSSWWTSTTKPVVHLSSGPAVLVSMWGSSESHSGATNLQGNITPPNSFILMNVGDKFDNATAAWAPLNETGYYKFALPGGMTYSGVVMLSEFQPVYFNTASLENETENETGPSNETGGGGGGGGGMTNETNETAMILNFTLAYDVETGIYTPLYANGNAQLANLTLGADPYTVTQVPKGNGTSSDPYRLENNQYSTMNRLFSVANKFMYPSFFGILLRNTTANVTIQDPAPFDIQYLTSMQSALAKLNLPSNNNLNMIFDKTSGITIYGASGIEGWFASSLGNTLASNVMFIDSTNFLVGDSNFNSMGSSLLIYNEAGQMGAGTIFGNHFLWSLITKSAWSASLKNGSDPYGLSVYSSGNLIYNNYFDTANPAFSPVYEPMTGEGAAYNNDWNLSQIQPLNFTMTVNGFNLTGNVIGVGYQGGNYWSEFDGTIPYTSDGSIAIGGDYYPLIPTTYTVTFNAINLPTGTSWGVVIDNVTITTTTSSVVFQEQNGTYSFSVISPSNYAVSPTYGTITVYGAPVNQSLTFTHVVYPITISMTGLNQGVEWGITLAGEPYTTTGSSITVYRDNGSYSYSIIVPALYKATPATGSIFVFGAPASLNVVFALLTYTITFEHQGLPTGTEWSVTFNGETINSTSPVISFTATNGNYTYTVSGIDGYSVSPASGYVIVDNASKNVSIEYTKNPNTLGTVGLIAGGIAVGAGVGVVLAYIFLRKPS